MVFKVELKIPPTLKKMMEDLTEMERSEVDAVAAEMLDAAADLLLEGMLKRVPIDQHDLEKTLWRDSVKQDGNLFSVEVGLMDAPKKIAIYGNVQEYGSGSVPAQSYVRATEKADKGKVYRKMRQIFKSRFGDK